jgi:ATP-dependent RNA helicase DDX24/MAK5
MATSDEDREPFLMYYLYKERMQSSKRSIVFVNAISYVYRLASLLPLCFPGCKVVGIHSNLRQKDRLKKLDQFKAGDNCIMVATDIAARGLDLPQVDSVVHLQPPRTPESLIHRSGRTARANRAGSCVMIITPTQVSEWKKSVRIALNKDVEEVDVLDVVSIDIRRIREIQRVANEIEGKTHKEKRESKDRAWTKKACEEADLWDSDASVSENDEFSDDKFDGVKRSNSGANPPRLSELEVLLKEPLPSLRK